MLGLHISVSDYQIFNVTLMHSCICTNIRWCVVLFGHNLLLALHPSLQALLADPGLKDGFNMATRIIQTFQLPVEDVLCHMAKALVLASRYQDVKDLLHLMQLTDVCPESSSDKIIISAVKTLSHHTKDVRCFVLYSPFTLVSEFVCIHAQPDSMYHGCLVGWFCSCLWFLFEDLDDWEVNHWLPSNQTSVPQLIETFSLFQLVGVNPVM